MPRPPLEKQVTRGVDESEPERFEQTGALQEIEALREKQPIVYEAMKRIIQAADRNAAELNRTIGRARVLTAPPAGYVPLGIAAFDTTYNVSSLPPPPTPTDDPTLPPDHVDPTAPQPPRQTPILNASRGRHTRVVSFR